MLFITLEGIDGAGKSTVARFLKERLVEAGHEVILTREPGGNEIAEHIRKVILEKKYVSMDPWTEALLYIAARKQHLNDVIIPALKEGKIVICDRFMDSTSVYQGYARGLGIRTVDEVQRTVIGSTQPDLTLFFDLTVEEARKRKISRFEESDRLDLENRDFFVKVHEGYQVLIGDNVDRIKVIDAEKPLKNVIEEAFLQIKDKIKDIKESV